MRATIIGALIALVIICGSWTISENPLWFSDSLMGWVLFHLTMLLGPPAAITVLHARGHVSLRTIVIVTGLVALLFAFGRYGVYRRITALPRGSVVSAFLSLVLSFGISAITYNLVRHRAPSETRWQDRPWWHIHRSSAIVLLAALLVLLYANLMIVRPWSSPVSIEKDNGLRSHYSSGWPLADRVEGSEIIDASGSFTFSKPYVDRAYPNSRWYNAYLAVAVALCACAAREVSIRLRQRTIQEAKEFGHQPASKDETSGY
jgi:hypothetical protein